MAGRERIYIVPRASGFLLALSVLLILGLGYAFDGLETESRVLGMAVFALGLAALFRTNANLQGVEAAVDSGMVCGFAGESTRLEVAVVNTSNERRTGLSLRPHGGRKARAAFVAQLAPHTRAHLTLDLPARPRGVHPLPALRLSTIRPQGLLYAWKIFHPAGDWIVAPRPRGAPLGLVPGSQPPGGDPSEVRPRRTGDPPARTDWKILARTGRWMVRESQEPPAQPLVFRWEETAHLGGAEERLGQLMLWVLEAAQAGRPFTLELGGPPVTTLPAACRRLAEFQP